MYLEGHEQRLIYHNPLGQEGKSGEWEPVNICSSHPDRTAADADWKKTKQNGGVYPECIL